MNWRTTTSGVLGAIVGAYPAIQHFLSGGFAAVTTSDMALFGAMISALVGLFHSVDKQNIQPK